MKGLLAIEWLKIKSYRTFWIIILLFCLLFPTWDVFFGGGLIKLGDSNINVFGSSSTFGDIWSTTGFYASHFAVFLSILVIILTTNEYQFRTNRQNVIDGWNRMDFFHAKWMVALATAAGATLFMFAIGLCMAIWKGVSFSNIGDGIEKVLWFFILCVNYMGFALLLALLLKRSGISIAILILYYMLIETMLHLLFIFKFKWFEGDLLLPLQTSDELLPSQASKMINSVGMISGSVPEWAYAAASLGWIVIYYMIGRQRLLKSDW